MYAKTLALLSAVAASLTPVPAAAQPPFYRQTVVVTAAATPIELGSATRSVTVITREEIRSLPAASIADVLRLVAPVDVRARGVRGAQTDFTVRGAGFGQVLVLLDGVRLNDAQSGHHNGDIPVPLEMVERIEVMYGPGSSLFGADAFGGTINVITRQAPADRTLAVEAGSFGAASARAQAGFTHGSISQTLGGAFERSSGFIAGRDFRTFTLHSRTAVGPAGGLTLAYQNKAFGARNFYGAAATGDAMSREWTNQTLIAADQAVAAAGWTIGGRGSYRTHGDRFLFSEATPAAASVHRTHEAIGSLTASRRSRTRGTITFGVESGGTWLRSNNLGDHATARVSGFGEWRYGSGRRAQLDAGLRLDRYNEFGASWSPSVGVGWWAAEHVRIRASAGRAFRVPTFTERYYSDRNHLARAEIGPERAWAAEAALDWFIAGGWIAQAAVFARDDDQVIDWICADRTCGTAGATERWRTYNVRDVSTRGLELSVRRVFGRGAFVHVAYAGLDVDAPALDRMSKYVLDVAPHSLTASGSVPLPGRLIVAPRVEYRRRTRPAGTSDDVVIDARIARPLGSRFELSIDGTNLGGASYEEVPGVRMPGAAFSVALTLRTSSR